MLRGLKRCKLTCISKEDIQEGMTGHKGMAYDIPRNEKMVPQLGAKMNSKETPDLARLFSPNKWAICTPQDFLISNIQKTCCFLVLNGKQCNPIVPCRSSTTWICSFGLHSTPLLFYMMYVNNVHDILPYLDD